MRFQELQTQVVVVVELIAFIKAQQEQAVQA
jgi:hypothetical protein